MPGGKSFTMMMDYEAERVDPEGGRSHPPFEGNRGRGGYSRPFSRALEIASTRLRTPILPRISFT